MSYFEHKKKENALKVAPPVTPFFLKGIPKTPDDDKYLSRMEEQKRKEKKEFWGKVIKFSSMYLLVVFFLLCELLGGMIGNSLALLSDAFHMTSDSISHIIGLFAVLLSARSQSSKLTFGWARSEVVGAMINSVFLLAVVYFIYIEAIQRIFTPEPITEPMLVLIVGGLGLAVNVLGLFIFGADEGGGEEEQALIHAEDHQECCYLVYERDKRRKAEEARRIKEENDPLTNANSRIGFWKKIHPLKIMKNLFASKKSANVRAVFLHIFGDFLGSIGVMISATILLLVPVEMDGDECVKNCALLYLDPGLSICIATIIMCTTVPLFISTVKILMQTVPSEVKLEDLKLKIKSIPYVEDVHNIRVWNLVGGRNIATMHVEMAKPSKFQKVANQIKIILHDLNVHSSTIQPEFIHDPEKLFPRSIRGSILRKRDDEDSGSEDDSGEEELQKKGVKGEEEEELKKEREEGKKEEKEMLSIQDDAYFKRKMKQAKKEMMKKRWKEMHEHYGDEDMSGFHRHHFHHKMKKKMFKEMMAKKDWEREKKRVRFASDVSPIRMGDTDENVQFGKDILKRMEEIVRDLDSASQKDAKHVNARSLFNRFKRIKYAIDDIEIKKEIAMEKEKRLKKLEKEIRKDVEKEKKENNDDVNVQTSSANKKKKSKKRSEKKVTFFDDVVEQKKNKEEKEKEEKVVQKKEKKEEPKKEEEKKEEVNVDEPPKEEEEEEEKTQ